MTLIFGPIYDAYDADIDTQLLIREFVTECCIIDPKRAVGKRELFAEYKAWMRSKGRTKAGGKQSFNRELRHVLPAIAIASVGQRVFVGIGLLRNWR